MGPEDHSARTVPADVGARMRKWRRAADRSLESVADAIGCSKGHLSQVENGKGNLSVPLLLAYCAEIRTPVSRVLEDHILAKHRDADRLAAEIVEKAGLPAVQWLAGLDRAELRLALERAHEAVEFARSRKKRSARKRSRSAK